MRKKVLFISVHGDPLAPLGSEQAGGQNNYVKQLALSLEKEGNQVDVLTHWNDSENPQIEKFGKSNRVIRIDAGQKVYVPKTKMFNLLPNFYEDVLQTISLDSYDVIHTHYWLSGMIGTFIQKDFQLPWVHINHSLAMAKESATGKSEPTRLDAEKLILSATDHVIATTHYEKKLIQSFVKKPSPISVHSIGIDEIFQPLNKEDKFLTQPYFFFAGRLEKTKGIYTLINAFRKLVNDKDLANSPKLIIAGGDIQNIDTASKLPKKTSLRQAVRGLENKIDFIGPQTQKQLAFLYNHAVATIVPSYYESFGMVAAEAQACGSPVIASKVGGLQEVVKNQTTGLHIGKANEKSLAHAMKILISNPNLRKKLGKEAIQHASKEFDWTKISNKIDSYYEVFLDDKQSLYISNRS